MLDDYQEEVRDLAEAKVLDNHEDLFAMVAALGHAKVPIKPELSEALMGSGPELPDSVPPEQALDLAVRPLIDELARSVTSPFEVMEAMSETAAVTPPALRCFMAHELALSPHAIMRDAVPLMLLDADAEVRQRRRPRAGSDRGAGHACRRCRCAGRSPCATGSPRRIARRSTRRSARRG